MAALPVLQLPALQLARSTILGRIPGPGMAPGRIDDAAIAAITDLYREVMPAGGAILDLMSSWIGHLPPEIPIAAWSASAPMCAPCRKTRFSTDWRVQDLNRDPILPFAAGEFDGATICGAIQHLTRPGELLREVARVLRPGAPLVVTFSQRCVATPAIACWCLLDDAGQLCLVARHFAEAGNWADIRCLDRTRPAAAARSTRSSAQPRDPPAQRRD